MQGHDHALLGLSSTSVLHAKRTNGARRASVRDFHSFRVTWITIALAAGVPLEIVQRVTGHKTVDVVLKHYFRPGREDFRHTLENAMPRLLMESIGSAQGGPARKVLPAASAGVRSPEAGGFTYPESETPAAMIEAAIVALERQTSGNWKGQRDEALRSVWTPA